MVDEGKYVEDSLFQAAETFQNGGAMKQKVNIDIFEVMKYLEIDPKKAYQFLSRLQYTEDESTTGGVQSRERVSLGKSRTRSKKMTDR
ncbi:hypothetical protein ACFFNY_35305 [Paenibacillus hodogayensis]|uniref:Uncharacterized protein n=1 Tax=Paenibacillus hodogayensis TaxID=279208 RepID=A0ABV5W8F6_9BACL